MKFFNSIGPNPRVVRIFAAEKGIELPSESVDLMGGENRKAAYLEKNPAGQLPCLQLDDGSFLSEITAICEYLEEKHPTPALVGTTPEERAETRMWTRRIDLNIVENLASGFRYAEGLRLFKDRIHVIPHAADDFKQIAQQKLAWLDGLCAGREFVCSDRFTLADVLLFAFLEFGASVGQPLDPQNAWLADWYARVEKRPAVASSK
ncbi:MAG: glutathione S-transferase family protein [Myxococcales bacterium]|nr:glutathione S-transferase family protein [Myxococcales bacterium]